MSSLPPPRLAVFVSLCGLSGIGGAQTPSAQPAQLEPVVVTGSRVETRVFDTPYAISVVDAEELRAGGLMVNLSESLQRVPGLTVNNRNNYAQDLQISSRGFGARSTFGVRGLRLYTDGIPATMPDGSGQVTHFDLAGAERIEVLRGPFSALYGNSSGGVIALFSGPARKRELEFDLDLGSDETAQARATFASPLQNGWDIRAGLSGFTTDNFRPHSSARRWLGNVRLGWQGERDQLVMLANAIDQPADDPLGLTRAQFDADPEQTTPEAIAFDTRKQAEQQQIGGQWTRKYGVKGFTETTLVAYLGHRSVTQWQAIPVATQANPRHPGGVIDFSRQYGGVDARALWRWDSATLVAGAAYERQEDDRKGFENFVGTPPNQQLGVTGALRRDEANEATTTDVYAQGEVTLTQSLSATLGVRSGRVKLSSSDHFLSNGDDSGSSDFDYTNPVASLQWRARPDLNFYVSVGRGFESPTLNEVAYRPDGSAGFNEDLEAQTSKQIEIGAKWRNEAARLGADLAIFRAETEDEIAVRTNTGGRSTFANVGRTLRQGVEVSAQWRPVNALRGLVALTWLDATYRDSFLTCAGTPCVTPTATVPEGNKIAGTSPRSAYAEVAWSASERAEYGLEWRGQGRIAVNDLNSDFAAGYGVFAVRARWTLQRRDDGSGVEIWGRIDNLADKEYAGSVIVNEGNSRFFEPGAPRSVLVGLRWKL